MSLSIDDKLDKLLERTATLKTQMEMLVGNGQKGRIKEIDEKISALEGSSNRVKGALYVLGAVSPPLGVALGWLLKKLGVL